MARWDGMMGDVCSRCFRPHGPPVCDHDSTKPCPVCGLPMGYLTPDMLTDGPCWFCLEGRPRPNKAPWTPAPQEEWIE